MKYWWLIFLIVFIAFLNNNQSLFYWYRMEGAGIGSPSTALLVSWWVYVGLLLTLLLIKFLHERREKSRLGLNKRDS